MRTMSPHLKVLQMSCSMQSIAPCEGEFSFSAAEIAEYAAWLGLDMDKEQVQATTSRCSKFSTAKENAVPSASSGLALGCTRRPEGEAAP